MSDLDKYTNYKTVLAVNALIWSKGKVLLLKRASTKKVDPDTYSGVGGKVEPGEDFLTAMLREIKEEIGITEFLSIHPYSITQIPFPASKAEWVNVYFTAEIAEQVEINTSEDGDFFWIDPADVDSLKIVNDLKDYIKILAENSKSFILGWFNFNVDGKLLEKSYKVYAGN